MSDPVRQLLRALAHSARESGCTAELSHAGQTRWATVTFAGARHTIRASAEPQALARWLATLPEAELTLHGHFVASCAAEVSGGQAAIELLVLEE